jgi:hypothetical protein
MFTFVAGEFQAKRLLQRRAQGRQSRETRFAFDSCLRISRIGSQEPRDLFGQREWSFMQEHPKKVFGKRSSDRLREFRRVGDDLPKVFLGVSNGETFELSQFPLYPADQNEIP